MKNREYESKDKNKNNFFGMIKYKIENLFDPSFNFWYDYTLGDEFSDNDVKH